MSFDSPQDILNTSNLMQQYRELLGSIHALDRENEANNQVIEQIEALARRAASAASRPDLTNTDTQLDAPSAWLQIAGRTEPISLTDIFTIGRGSNNNLVLQDPDVSRSHARLEKRGEDFWLVDLKSSNGTWINQQRISGPTMLQPGDQVRVGNTTFELVSTANSNATRIQPGPILAPQPAPTPASQKFFCRHCGKATDPSARFCRSCGQPLT